MSDDIVAKRADALYSQPFVPSQSSGTGLDSPATIRIAAATEYAAAQLGVIARTAEKIESHLASLVHQGGASHVPPEMPADFSAALRAIQGNQKP